MQRRKFVQSLIGGALALPAAARAAAPAPQIITVDGPIAAADLGVALAHEHVLVDFIGATEVGPHRYDHEQVVAAVLPHLKQACALGARAFFECTPQFLGRDPRLLRRLGAATGLHLVTNTGLYGALNDKGLPAYAFTDSATQLAARWTTEARDGVDGTSVRPGFIKCGVDPAPQLSDVDRKLVQAAALTHRATGLTIAVHTGRGPGLAQLEILRTEGVAPAAWIWVHAQGARDDDLFAAADRGAWLGLDGISPKSLDRHLQLCDALRRRGHLGRVLLSHDAGWFDPAKPGGGTFRPYDMLFTRFVPALRERGFGDADIDTLLRGNPARAFAVGQRLL
jgi:phosphotriesterase-related protein